MSSVCPSCGAPVSSKSQFRYCGICHYRHPSNDRGQAGLVDQSGPRPVIPCDPLLKSQPPQYATQLPQWLKKMREAIQERVRKGATSGPAALWKALATNTTTAVVLSRPDLARVLPEWGPEVSASALVAGLESLLSAAAPEPSPELESPALRRVIGPEFSQADYDRALSALDLCLQDHPWRPGENQLIYESVLDCVKAKGITLALGQHLVQRLIVLRVFAYRSDTKPAGLHYEPGSAIPVYCPQAEITHLLVTSQQRWYGYLSEYRRKVQEEQATSAPPPPRKKGRRQVLSQADYDLVERWVRAKATGIRLKEFERDDECGRGAVDAARARIRTAKNREGKRTKK